MISSTASGAACFGSSRAPVRPPQPRVRARLGRSTVQSGRSDAYRCEAVLGSGCGSSYSCTVAQRTGRCIGSFTVTATRSSEKRAEQALMPLHLCKASGGYSPRVLFPTVDLWQKSRNSNRNGGAPQHAALAQGAPPRKAIHRHFTESGDTDIYDATLYAADGRLSRSRRQGPDHQRR